MRVRQHLKLRSDLTWRRFVTEGQEAYIFKDEISQEYLKLDVISGALALRLDGKTSAEELLAYARETWPVSNSTPITSPTSSPICTSSSSSRTRSSGTPCSRPVRTRNARRSTPRRSRTCSRSRSAR